MYFSTNTNDNGSIDDKNNDVVIKFKMYLQNYITSTSTEWWPKFFVVSLQVHYKGKPLALFTILSKEKGTSTPT